MTRNFFVSECALNSNANCEEMKSIENVANIYKRLMRFIKLKYLNGSVQKKKI